MLLSLYHGKRLLAKDGSNGEGPIICVCKQGESEELDFDLMSGSMHVWCKTMLWSCIS